MNRAKRTTKNNGANAEPYRLRKSEIRTTMQAIDDAIKRRGLAQRPGRAS